MLLRHRINLCDAAVRQTDADTRKLNAETDRMDLTREHDRLDRLVAGQALLPFVEFDDLLRASARRGRKAPSVASPPAPALEGDSERADPAYS
jgi:hypothetical protein